jgi:hypothetical protein
MTKMKNRKPTNRTTMAVNKGEGEVPTRENTGYIQGLVPSRTIDLSTKSKQNCRMESGKNLASRKSEGFGNSQKVLEHLQRGRCQV